MASATRNPFAAGFLNEPILPNGIFAGVVIVENNSSDPQAERDIISEQSYRWGNQGATHRCLLRCNGRKLLSRVHHK
jgi:hypothetical protein